MLTYPLFPRPMAPHFSESVGDSETENKILRLWCLESPGSWPGRRVWNGKEKKSFSKNRSAFRDGV